MNCNSEAFPSQMNQYEKISKGVSFNVRENEEILQQSLKKVTFKPYLLIFLLFIC